MQLQVERAYVGVTVSRIANRACATFLPQRDCISRRETMGSVKMMRRMRATQEEETSVEANVGKSIQAGSDRQDAEVAAVRRPSPGGGTKEIMNPTRLSCNHTYEAFLFRGCAS